MQNALNNGLAGKSNNNHNHSGVYQPVGDYATNGALNNGLAGKANNNHNHIAAQVTFTDGQTFQQKLDNGSLKGQQGERGSQGIQGVQGLKGDTGLQGPIGQQGSTGPQGYTGATGAAGKDAGMWNPRTLDNSTTTLPYGGTWVYIAIYGTGGVGLMWYRPKIGSGSGGRSLIDNYGTYNGAVCWRIA